MRKVLSFFRRHPVSSIIVILLLYVAIGALAPFAVPGQLSVDEKTFSKEDYYTEDPDAPCADRAHIVEENQEALTQRIRMLELARKEVILSTFDFREDESTTDLSAAIYHAARRGVKVNILVDGMSGLLRMEGKPFFYALSSHPNIHIRIYNTVNPLRPWSINGRMHDKYVICDDQLLLLGGRNTFDYFLGSYPTDSRSYDREVLIYNTDFKNGCTNSVISQVKAYFQSIWESSYVKDFHDQESLSSQKSVQKKILLLEDRYKTLSDLYPECFQDYSYQEHTVPTQKTCLIFGPVTPYGKKPYVWNTLQCLMASAREKVILHTPYVVLDKEMSFGIKEISQNVSDFSMIINSVENGDNVIASSDYLLHKQQVLDTGAALYEFDGGQSSHGKSILIDDDLSLIGSYNLDMRSTYMDTELMLCVQSKELNQELLGYLNTYLAQSRRILDKNNYEMPKGMIPQTMPLPKQILYRILGPLLQPFRYVA